ncbi:hypothetical protein GALMADRAFT_243071 [Galerina marginata CBS 339.88]|uniref:Uncharacterized protein n=1 Tax=Galerina marginata (strain CBS 339.88) TaxID=685588 RepID=A0A067T9Y1_GALM3|nr:hypothetical protein GALMADRAFT_243071 [Galerina marginata CBS 339.88]
MRFFFLYVIFPFVSYLVTLLCVTYYASSPPLTNLIPTSRHGNHANVNNNLTTNSTVDLLSAYGYGFIPSVVAPSVGLASVIISTTLAVRVTTRRPASEDSDFMIFMAMLLESWAFTNLIIFAIRPQLEVFSYPTSTVKSILVQLTIFCLLYFLFYGSLVSAGLNREQMGLLGFLPFYLARCLVAGITAIFWTITFPFTCLGSTLVDIGTIVINLWPAVISLEPAVISLGNAVVNFGTKMIEFFNYMHELLGNKVPTSPTLPPPCPITSAHIPLASSQSDINVCLPPPYSPPSSSGESASRQ